MRVVLVVVLLLVALGAGAEVAVRQVLDRELTERVTSGLDAASESGFQGVQAEEEGWALPDLARGRLSRVDVVAGAGELGGVPLTGLTLTAHDVDITTGSAGSVVADAGVDLTALVADVADDLGLGGSEITITVLDENTVRLQGQALGNPVVLDVALGLDGTGGLLARATSATIAGMVIDPSHVVSGDVVLVDAADLPDGLALTAGTLSAAPDGAPGGTLTVSVGCDSGCALTGAL